MNYCVLLSLFITTLLSGNISLQEINWQDSNAQVILNVELKPSQLLYKEFFKLSTNNPEVTIQDWISSISPVTLYDRNFKDSKVTYSGNFTITVTLSYDSIPAQPVTLYVTYLLSTDKDPQQAHFELQSPINQPLPEDTQTIVPTPTTAQSSRTSLFDYAYQTRDYLINIIQDVKIYVSSLVSHTESLIIRLVAVFILGLLMSLTPCIYPMIPITVGILQTTTGGSLFKNFLLAASYTFGMACTFAILGLLAATGSAQFGMLLGNPIFVTLLVGFLAYLAGSMLGIYELHIPRFMQPKKQHVKGGSYVSAFVFGILSGSVASPCLSPGLLLLLSIVATLGSIWMGFVLLFVFGLGLGLPLLIIGTFSNSMNLLPRAGLWMIEIKKLFGLMLISMCFYYLSAILAWKILLVLISLTCFGLGIFTIVTIKSYESSLLKRYKYVVGITLFIISFIAAIKSLYYHPAQTEIDPTISSIWLCSYEEAHAKALEENKLLFVDFGATWCSACTEVAHKITHTPTVTRLLDTIVAVYVDCTNPHAISCSQAQKQFNVLGFPTLLLVDPKTNTVIKRWSSELLDVGAEAFAQELKQLLNI